MVALQIRGVSEPTRSTLSAEAKARGESLQDYLLDVLDHEAQEVNSRRVLADWAAPPLTDAAQLVESRVDSPV